MKNKTKGLIAGIAGIALLTGGSTFALWSDSATVAGGTITNGNLDIAALGTPTWQDVSDDREDGPHDIIDIAEWRMVPGDVAEGTYSFEVALEGDNLVANLGVDTTASPLPTGVTVTYDVLDEAGTVVAEDVELGTDSTLRFAAGRDGQDDGAPDNTDTIVVDKTALEGADANLTVVVTVSFAASTGNQVSVTEESVLGNLLVSLSQDRSGVDFK